MSAGGGRGAGSIGRPQELPDSPNWAQPRTMTRTYAALYNSLGCIPTLMDVSLWRIVYGGAAMRPRNESWALAVQGSEIERHFAYTNQRRLVAKREAEGAVRERIGAIQADADHSTRSVLKSRLASERIELLRAAAPTRHHFQRPPRTTLRAMPARHFEVQLHDAHLCGVHAVNNLANGVLLSPPDLLQAIELVRPLDNLFASPEELAVALLREGVFTVPILLQRDYLRRLSEGDEFDANDSVQHCLDLIDLAGGLVVYDGGGQIDRSASTTGHFVTLVRQPKAPLPVPGVSQPKLGGLDVIGDHEWCVFSTNSIVAHGYTIADALLAYMSAIRPDDYQGESGGCNLLALLPLSLEPLFCDIERRTAGTNTRRSATSAPQSTEQLKRVAAHVSALRSLLRRSLSESTVTESADRDDVRDIAMPRPLTMLGLDAVVAFYDADVAQRNYYNGTGPINVASVIAARMFANDLIGGHGRELFVTLRDHEQQRISAEEARSSLLASMRQLRSAILDVQVLPLLFSMRVSFELFEMVIPGGEWLRLYALYAATTCAIAARTVEQLDDIINLIIDVCDNHERSLELLERCCAERLPHCDTLLAFVPIVQFELEEHDRSPDRCRFIALLRQTLFAMPGEAIDFALLVDHYAKPEAAERRFGAAARDYMSARAAELAARIHDVEYARELTDCVAFDVRMIDAGAPEPSMIGVERRDEQPRFLERLFELGVGDAMRGVYGCYTRAPDQRAVIVDNAARVPLPDDDNWTATSPFCCPAACLCVLPLSTLPPLGAPPVNWRLDSLIAATAATAATSSSFTSAPPHRPPIGARSRVIVSSDEASDDDDVEIVHESSRRRLN